MLHIVRSESNVKLSIFDKSKFDEIINRYNVHAEFSPNPALLSKLERELSSANFSFKHANGTITIEKNSGLLLKNHSKITVLNLADERINDSQLKGIDRNARINYAIRKDNESLVLKTGQGKDHLYSNSQVARMKESKHSSVRELGIEKSDIAAAASFYDNQFKLNVDRLPSESKRARPTL